MTCRPEDSVFARTDPEGFRWYRCPRCDSWVPTPEPGDARTETPPERAERERDSGWPAIERATPEMALPTRL